MPNNVTRHISNELYIAAALLFMFGFAKTYGTGPSRSIQLVLGVGCGVAGYVVRMGGPAGRIAGLAAAGATAGYGVFCLWTGRGFVTGSIIAIYALVRLLSTPDAFTASPVAYPLSSTTQQFVPPQSLPVQQAWPVAVRQAPADHSSYSPQWSPSASTTPPPAPMATPSWSDEQLQRHFAPPPPAQSLAPPQPQYPPPAPQ